MDGNHSPSYPKTTRRCSSACWTRRPGVACVPWVELVDGGDDFPLGLFVYEKKALDILYVPHIKEVH